MLCWVSFQSRVTDFLDVFDEDASVFKLAGVLDKHYEPTDATYYRVMDMVPWMEKYVLGKRSADKMFTFVMTLV